MPPTWKSGVSCEYFRQARKAGPVGRSPVGRKVVAETDRLDVVRGEGMAGEAREAVVGRAQRFHLELGDHALGEVVQAARDGLVVEPGRPHRDARHAQVLEAAHAVQVGTAPARAELDLLRLAADAAALLAQHAEERAELLGLADGREEAVAVARR